MSMLMASCADLARFNTCLRVAKGSPGRTECVPGRSFDGCRVFSMPLV